MYAEDNENCPVKSPKMLFEKLHTDCDALFQYLNTNYRQTGQWYNKMPLGKNTLATLMKKISEKVQLSHNYTKRSIRATSITVLANAGIDSTSITPLSSHKYVESLKLMLSDPARKKMPPN